MNLPFPSMTPRLVDSRWFNADTPCDEEVEVAMVEQKFQIWLTSVGQRYLNMNPLGKIAPEPMEEEAETDEEEGNDDSDDTEDTQDDEDEEEMVYTPEGAALFVPPPGRAAHAGAAAGNPDAETPPPGSGNNNNDIVMNDSNANDRVNL